MFLNDLKNRLQPHATPTLFLSTEEVEGAATGSTINEPSCSSAYVDPSLFLIEIHIYIFFYRVTETTNSAPMTESLFSPSKNTQTEQSIFQYAKEEEDQRRD
jgi:hypothetical protein